MRKRAFPGWSPLVLLLLPASPGAGLPTVETPLAEAAVEPMPVTAFPSPEGVLGWVTATHLVRADGSLEEGVVPAGYERVIQRTLHSYQEHDCVVGSDVVRPTGDRRDLARALRSSTYAFIARVTGVAHGFRHTIAGTLFRVATDEVFKGPQSIGVEYFFFLPVGEFTAGPFRVCKRNVGYPAVLPKPGDQVLLLAEGIPSRDNFLQIAGHNGLVVIQADGSVILPRAYLQKDRASEPATRDHFAAWLRGLEVDKP